MACIRVPSPPYEDSLGRVTVSQSLTPVGGNKSLDDGCTDATAAERRKGRTCWLRVLVAPLAVV